MKNAIEGKYSKISVVRLQTSREVLLPRFFQHFNQNCFQPASDCQDCDCSDISRMKPFKCYMSLTPDMRVTPPLKANLARVGGLPLCMPRTVQFKQVHRLYRYVAGVDAVLTTYEELTYYKPVHWWIFESITQGEI